MAVKLQKYCKFSIGSVINLFLCFVQPFARRILALPDTRVSPPMFATVEQTSTKLHPPAMVSVKEGGFPFAEILDIETLFPSSKSF